MERSKARLAVAIIGFLGAWIVCDLSTGDAQLRLSNGSELVATTRPNWRDDEGLSERVERHPEQAGEPLDSHPTLG